MSFNVIWNNWYGRKQERTLQLLLNCYQRLAPTGDVRATHAYTDVDHVEWSKDGSLVVHLVDGSTEHYISARRVGDIAAAFQRHCRVVAL